MSSPFAHLVALVSSPLLRLSQSVPLRASGGTCWVVLEKVPSLHPPKDEDLASDVCGADLSRMSSPDLIRHRGGGILTGRFRCRGLVPVGAFEIVLHLIREARLTLQARSLATNDARVDSIRESKCLAAARGIAGSSVLRMKLNLVMAES